MIKKQKRSNKKQNRSKPYFANFFKRRKGEMNQSQTLWVVVVLIHTFCHALLVCDSSNVAPPCYSHYSNLSDVKLNPLAQQLCYYVPYITILSSYAKSLRNYEKDNLFI